MPDAPVLTPAGAGGAGSSSGGRQEGQTGRGRIRGALQRSAGAPERARRAGRAPPRHRCDEDARDGLRRQRQAVAPEGHRPRPRRLQPLADLDRRWRRLRSAAAQLHLQGQPQGEAHRAAQRAFAARGAGVAGCFRRRCVRGAQNQAGRRAAAGMGRTAADARRAERRGVSGGAVLPQPRARRRAHAREHWRHRSAGCSLAARLAGGAGCADRARGGAKAEPTKAPAKKATPKTQAPEGDSVESDEEAKG